MYNALLCSPIEACGTLSDVDLALIIAENVKSFRKSSNPPLSQYTLADRSRLSRGTIANLELAKSGKPDLDTLAKIADALGVSVADLMTPQTVSISGNRVAQTLLESPWAHVLNPTDEEISWLKSLPETTWHGVEPSGEIIAEFIQALRRSRSKLSDQ